MLCLRWCVCVFTPHRAGRIGAFGLRGNLEAWFAVGGRTWTDRRQSTPLSGPDGVDVQFLSIERRGERNFLV